MTGFQNTFTCLALVTILMAACGPSAEENRMKSKLVALDSKLKDASTRIEKLTAQLNEAKRETESEVLSLIGRPRYAAESRHEWQYRGESPTG
jgi:hypothetical protein